MTNTYKIKLNEFSQTEIEKATPIKICFELETIKIGREIIIPKVLSLKPGILVNISIGSVKNQIRANIS